MPPCLNLNDIYPEYVPGETVHVGSVVYRGRIVPLDVYQAFGLSQITELAHTSVSTAKVKLPVFSGKDSYNLDSWLATVEARLTLNEIPENRWVREMANALEGLASDWFNGWIKEVGEHDWPNFVPKIKTRFGGKHSALVIARMRDNLKHTGTVDENIREHERI